MTPKQRRSSHLPVVIGMKLNPWSNLGEELVSGQTLMLSGCVVMATIWFAAVILLERSLGLRFSHVFAWELGSGIGDAWKSEHTRSPSIKFVFAKFKGALDKYNTYHNTYIL